MSSQTHGNKLTGTSSKLNHNSTRFSQKQAVNSHTLKGSRQLEKTNILRHVIQNGPPSGFDAHQCLTHTRAEDRSELHRNCSKQAQKSFQGISDPFPGFCLWFLLLFLMSQFEFSTTRKGASMLICQDHLWTFKKVRKDAVTMWRVGPRLVGAQTQKGGGPKVETRRVGGPKGWGAQMFTLFFPLPPCISQGRWGFTQ